MARITGEIQETTLQRLRHYLINTDGSTKKMGAFLEEVIRKELDARENLEKQGNAEAPCLA